MSSPEETAAARQRLRVEIAALKDQAAPLALEKKQLEAALSTLNARVRMASRHHLPPYEYRAVCNEQVSCKRRIVRIEAMLQEGKARLRAKQTELDALEASSPSGIMPPDRRMALRDEMRRLRDHWQALSTDATRPEKERGMAAEFATELRELLALLDGAGG